MTDRLAIILGLILVSLITADLAMNDGNALFFLARKGIDLIDYLIFWR